MMSQPILHLLSLALHGAHPVPSAQADSMVYTVQPERFSAQESQDATQPVAFALNPREVKPPPPLYDSEERQRQDNRDYRRTHVRDRDYDLDYENEEHDDRSRSTRRRRNGPSRGRDGYHQRRGRRSNRHRDYDHDRRSTHRRRGRQEHRSANYYHDDRYDDRYDNRRHAETDRRHHRADRSHHQGSRGNYQQARHQQGASSRSKPSSTSKQRVTKSHETESNEGPQHLLELGFGPFGHWWGAEISYLYHLNGGSVGPAVGAIISGSSAPGVQSFSLGGKFQWDFDLFPNQDLKFFAGPFAGLSYQWKQSMRTDIGATLRMVVQERWLLFVQPVALSVFTYLGKGPGDRFWPTYHGAAGLGVVF